MKVMVNPNYQGEGWYDARSMMQFSKESGIIEVPDDVDLRNVKRYLTLGYLLPEEIFAEKVKEEPSQPATKTPGELLVEKEEAPQEIEIEEEPEVEEEVIQDDEYLEVDEPEEETPDKVACQFCGKEYSFRGVNLHEKACKKNPENK